MLTVNSYDYSIIFNGGSAAEMLSHPLTITTRDYCGNYVYRNDTLERVMTDVGYIDGATQFHHAFVHDYQGNVRAVVRQNGTLVEYNAYYPYGMLMTGSAASTSNFVTSPTGSVQPYKYTGKELDRENGLDTYDFEARCYDPALATTWQQDPLADKYTQLSPYLWCAANPIRNTDPTGKEVLNHFHQSDQRLYNWAKNYKDDNAIHVFAHGTSDGKGLVLNYNKVGEPITIIKSTSQFKSIVLSHSKIWKLSRQSGKPVVIILHSCLTGNNVSSFAYKLSKDEELKTMTIIAPTREIGVDKSYKSEVRTLIKDNNGRPIGRESGWWIFIRNGKVFDSFGPKWEAKEEPSFWDKLFK